MMQSNRLIDAFWIEDLLLPAASNLAIKSGWSKALFAKWLCCWLDDVVPLQLLQWLCLNDLCRIEAEQEVVSYLKEHDRFTMNLRHISREKKMSRNTCWAKTFEKSNGAFPTTYCNNIRIKVPDRFLYGAFHWLIRKWYFELIRFKKQIIDADSRIDRLERLLHLPILANNVPIPFQVRHQVKLYELHAFELVERLQRLNLLECSAFSDSDRDNLRSIFDINDENREKLKLDNLFELLILLQSAEVMQKDGWKFENANIVEPQKSGVPPKPVIHLTKEFEKEKFCCQISKGGIRNLDRLSNPYRGDGTSGFDPDVVYLFSKYSESAKGRPAVVFLGDAKHYITSNHDVAVRDKLLNVFAFARALGIQIQSNSDSLISFHHIDDNIPVPSFLLFFPTLCNNETDSGGAKSERLHRNVFEKFAVSCLQCDEHSSCKVRNCPGNLRDSFRNILKLISAPSFKWPLILNQNNQLIESD